MITWYYETALETNKQRTHPANYRIGLDLNILYFSLKQVNHHYRFIKNDNHLRKLDEVHNGIISRAVRMSVSGLSQISIFRDRIVFRNPDTVTSKIFRLHAQFYCKKSKNRQHSKLLRIPEYTLSRISQNWNLRSIRVRIPRSNFTIRTTLNKYSIFLIQLESYMTDRQVLPIWKSSCLTG